MANKPDWEKIRAEYETTKISYRKLATKYGVSFSTLKQRAKRENWHDTAEEIRKDIDDQVATKVTQKLTQKIAEHKADQIVSEIDTAMEATVLINQLILDTLKDAEQFKRHLVQRKEKVFNTTGKSKDSPATTESSERWWVEEKQFEVVDTKRLQAAAHSLKLSKDLQRLLNGLMPENEAQKLQIERERLEIDRIKAGLNDNEDNETGVVILPDVEEAKNE